MIKITLFSQIVNRLDKNIFKTIVRKKGTDKHSKGINSWTHLVSMIFCQLSKSNSLREISNGLRSATGNLNHLGIQRSPSKSSLSYINGHRDWTIFKDYYYGLYEMLYKEAKFQRKHFKIRKKRILLLDATLISVCLKLFDWARYRRAKGAVKLHVLLDYESCLPIFLNMTDGKVHENVIAKTISLPPDSVVVADRGYIDFDTFSMWNLAGNNFVVRLKSNIKHIRIKERELPDKKAQHILVDEVIELSEEASRQKYPNKLRRVVVFDEKNNQTIELITNNFSWTAETIAELYKQRWMIEIFFKELKQLLKIKTFVGTSVNAVMIQIWTAMISILILKYLKAIAKYCWSLSNLVAFLRLNLFVKIELILWLDNPFSVEDSGFSDDFFQLKLF
jgi:hypothetical protein